MIVIHHVVGAGVSMVCRFVVLIDWFIQQWIDDHPTRLLILTKLNADIVNTYTQATLSLPR